MLQAFQNRSAPEEKQAGKTAAAAKPKAKEKGKAKANEAGQMLYAKPLHFLQPSGRRSGRLGKAVAL